jgi:hypothetical protein
MSDWDDRLADEMSDEEAGGMGYSRCVDWVRARRPQEWREARRGAEPALLSGLGTMACV